MSWEWKMDVSGHFTDGTEIPNLLSVLPCSPKNHISGCTCKGIKPSVFPLYFWITEKNVVLWKFAQTSRYFMLQFYPSPSPRASGWGGTALTDLTVSFMGTGTWPSPRCMPKFSSKVLPRRCLQFFQMEPWQELPEDTHQSKLKEK